MKILSWVCLAFLLAGAALQGERRQDLSDGLYGVLQGSPDVGRLLYRLDVNASSAQVVRFLTEYGGKLKPDTQSAERFVVEQTRPVVVKWRIAGMAAVLGANSWQVPDKSRLFPLSPNPTRAEGAAVLAFWRQRHQFRSDILLLTEATRFYRPLQHRAFGYAVDTPVVLKLREDGLLWLSEVLALGDEAQEFILSYQQGSLEVLQGEQLWQSWLLDGYPDVAERVAKGGWWRDAYGFYLQGEAGRQEVREGGLNVEFSYQFQNVRFADLSGELDGVALLGRDRLPPVVDYFLRRIPVGETWTVLVPPWLNQEDDGRDDDSWYRYTIAVTAIF